MISPSDYFDLENARIAALWTSDAPVWSVLLPSTKETWIQNTIEPNAQRLETTDGWVTKRQVIDVPRGTFEVHPGVFLSGDIEIREGCVLESGAYVQGPTYLGPGTTVRQGAYIRGGVWVEEAGVVGHATEVKSAVFLKGAKAGHFAYVGDSILGNDVNLGAGTKISNLKITNTEIILQVEGQTHATGLRKFGGILGDGVQTGCNAVINPGTLLGKQSMVYPVAAPKSGVYPAKNILR